MALTAKERMRLYRQRMKTNPEKYNQYLVKERTRWKKRTDDGRISKINDLTDREKRTKRKAWREDKKAKRKATKEIHEKIRQAVVTPPSSPAYSPDNSQDEERRNRGRPRIRKDRAKAYRKIKQLEEELLKKTKQADMYRKRHERAIKKINAAKSTDKNKGYKIMKESRLRGKLRKQLLLHCIVANEIKKRMKDSKSQRSKRFVSRIVSGKLLKKYKLMGEAQELLGISYKRMVYNSKKLKSGNLKRKQYKNAISKEVKERVSNFFQEDLNSRLLPGKKDTITRRGVKMQKRILTSSMKQLHEQFLKLNNPKKISYAMFCRLRPFWVVEPSCSSRDTCTCKLHSNVSFMFERLKEHRVLKAKSLREAGESLCCDPLTKQCMYRECETCNSKCLQTNEYEEGKQVWVYSWKNRHEQRTVQKANGPSTIDVQVTVKEKDYWTLENLLEETNTILKNKFCRHVYNITHQYTELKKLKENISDHECIVHIDFSENYACKMHEETQGMHFGAPRNQVSLHTVVVYMKDSNPISICSLSESSRHDPSAIWAHLDPVLSSIKSKYEQIDTLHFISDGPTTQYRSRKNFFLMKERCHNIYAMKFVTWNFTESGHGKGAPDGVGGLLKRTADKLVAYGADITSVDELCERLTAEKIAVKLYKVDTNKIHEIDNKLAKVRIQPVPGTMKLHQVLSDKESNDLRIRDLSCFCKQTEWCNCFNLKTVPLKFEVLGDSGETTVDGETRTVVAETKDDDTHKGLDVVPSVDIIGTWVVVEYDKLPYPGIVQDIDHEAVNVKVMNRIGNNRYFWPLHDDVLWYSFEHLIASIPGMEQVTKRHMQINPTVWEAICTKMEL